MDIYWTPIVCWEHFGQVAGLFSVTDETVRFTGLVSQLPSEEGFCLQDFMTGQVL